MFGLGLVGFGWVWLDLVWFGLVGFGWVWLGLHFSTSKKSLIFNNVLKQCTLNSFFLGVPKKRPERPGASRASTVLKGWSLFCRHAW